MRCVPSETGLRPVIEIDDDARLIMGALDYLKRQRVLEMLPKQPDEVMGAWQSIHSLAFDVERIDESLRPELEAEHRHAPNVQEAVLETSIGDLHDALEGYGEKEASDMPLPAKRQLTEYLLFLSSQDR